MNKNIGYNLTLGGEGSSGYKHTEISKKKMSESKKNNYNGKSNPFYGKKHTIESKAKIASFAKNRTGDKNPFYGKEHSQETLNHLKDLNTGSKNPKAKFTELHILEIRNKYLSGKYSWSQLAKEYGTTKRYIGSIIRRQTWKHI